MPSLEDFNDLIPVFQENQKRKITLSDQDIDRIAKRLVRQSKDNLEEIKGITPSPETLHKPFTV